MLRCCIIRTTIRIDDALYREVKERAARQGRSVGQLIEDALRRSLITEDRIAPQPVSLPVYGGSGVLPGVDLSSNAGLREAMDGAEAVDALR